MASMMDGDGKVAVFNYGSNGVAQLRARVHNPTLTLARARAPGFARVFCGRAATWFDGGVASLAPGGGAVGSLALLTAAEKLRLDGFEKPKYREVEIDVEALDEGGTWVTRRAVAYVAGDGVESWTEEMAAPPSEAYRTAIAAHLRTAGWPLEPLEIRCAARGLVDTWRFPDDDPARLSLESLCVEVGAGKG